MFFLFRNIFPHQQHVTIKILIYAYLRNTCSSRCIEDFVTNDVQFMFLSGMQRPDHNTIYIFRSSKLSGTLKEIFAQIVRMMVEDDLVRLERVYTDGSKIESAAGRYTFVWSKSVARNSARIAEQIDELWEYARKITGENMRDHTPVAPHEVTSDRIESLLGDIQQVLGGGLRGKEGHGQTSLRKEGVERTTETGRGRNGHS